MTKFAKNFLSNESGATAIEYGLIAALIAVVAIGAMTAIGTNLNNTFTNVMAAANLRSAAVVMREMEATDERAYQRLMHRLQIDEAEIDEWEACAEGMVVLFDETYWRSVINFDAMVAEGMVASEDLNLFKFAENAEDVWQSLLDCGLEPGKDIS